MPITSSSAGLALPRALGLQVIYTLVYVVPLYFSAATRPSPTRSRDAPEAIRARIRVVSVSTALCSMATFALLSSDATPPAVDPWHFMGYWPVGLTDALRALCLTTLLFAGPLYECLIIDGAWRQWLHGEALNDIWNDWPTWRNMVAGPITEECLFRSAGVPLLIQAGASLTTTIFLSPLVFGLAHVHHFYEFRITHARTPLPVAITRSLLQLTYTSLFGAYATFLFMRTGSLLSVIIVHAFCNCMGLPRFWGQVEPFWLLERVTGSSSSSRWWTAGYYVLLVTGLVAWWQNLYSLTETPMAIARF